ncbi:peroxide stress protein YaaA [Roseateles sp. DAIF2]|uniref:peroxide stress protein YaaA n=1 Tax=Roseateles sp. DAIF2 TaxID=2714952 RepID=UPI0018A27F3B|nr:peroxide stress protein YaaA [Roseateles sp. DAIF2]QPF74486.1 peroxide stress protein YaaA [Roseateles sp. DAIF2]
MLYLLSPAKSLDYETPVPAAVAGMATEPQFLPRSAELIKVLKTKSPAAIAELMDLSEALSTLNVERYRAWQPQSTEANSRPAVLAFNGDVYEGLQAASLDLEQLQWAQQHLAILSGLYGVLRPLDRLQPYRLEMGTRLATKRGKSLYEFWGDELAEHLNRRIAEQRVPVIVNLASQEYFRAADRKALQPRVLECQFEDWKNGQYKIISFFAKRARGLMARYCIEHKVDRPEGLLDFKVDGYAYEPALSTPERLLFRRRLA